MVFTTDSLMWVDSSGFVINVPPDLETDSGLIIPDTMNWIQFDMLYTARGGERFFTVGLFREYTQITTAPNIPADYTNAYIYVDDFYIADCTNALPNTTSTKPFIRLFPNPTASNTTCEFRFPAASGKAVVSLTDVSGRVLFEIETENALVELPTSTLTNGLYFVQLKSNGRVLESQKLLVQRN